MAVKFQLRRGTASQWTSSNPTLAAGELGIETDTSKAKVGDGTTAWNSLPYFAGGGGASSNVFSSNVIIDVSTTDPALRVTQRGTGLALRVEDSTTPDASPFVVDASGNVGIGTSTPNTLLEITGAGSPTVRVNSTDGQVPTLQLLRTGGTGFQLRACTDIGLYLDTANSSSTIKRIFSINGVPENSGSLVTLGPSEQATNPFNMLHIISANAFGIRLQRTGTNPLDTAVRNQGNLLDLWANGGSGIAFSTGTGTSAPAERIRIDTTGRLGIGTSSPASLLHVFGNNEFSLGSQFQTTSNQTSMLSHPVALHDNFGTAAGNGLGVRFRIADTGGTLRTAAGVGSIAEGKTASSVFAGMYFYTGTDSTEKMRITANGRVGIGTVSPTTNVHIRFNNINDVGFRVHQNNTTQFAGAGVNATTPFGGTSFYTYNIDATGNAAAGISRTSNTGSFIQGLWVYDYISNSHAFSTSSAERMRIDSTGNVSIGTSDTTQGRLTIRTPNLGQFTGNTQRIIRQSAPNGNETYLDTTNRRWLAGTDWSNTNIRIQKTVDVTPQGFIDFGIDGLRGDHGLGFGSSSTTHMAMLQTGSVGIGTTSPAERLHVDAASNEFIVQLSKTGSNNWVIGAAGPTSRRLYFRNKDNSQEVLTLTDIGRIGIANTNPPERLFVSGNIAATGTITASYSDERLKERLGNVNNSINIIQSLNGFKYKNNDLAKSLGYGGDAVQIGLSAQEVEKVLPEVVSLAPFDMARDEQDNLVSKSGNNYLTLDYSKIVPVLIEAVKELAAEVEKLKRKE